jgi:hypothetical protein
VLVDYTRDDGDNIILNAVDCLLVTAKYALSETNKTKTSSYGLINGRRISDWLSGTKRGRGRGGREESVFTRLDIIDPRTNKALRIVPHDVRHWLNSVLNDGGATQETIRLVFARKSQLTNATYDQTSALTRVNRLKEDIRSGKVFGEIQDNFNVILAEYGRDDAESYLKSKTAMMVSMPHGSCTLSWTRPSCEKYMSCFAGDKMCEDLCINMNDNEQHNNVIKVFNEQTVLLTVIPESSPQHKNIKKIVKNIQSLIDTSKEFI